MQTLEEFVTRINERLEKVEVKTEDLEIRMDAIEDRVEKLNGKIDTMLDSQAQIKRMLSENTSYSKSAKNNSFGWGVLGFVSSVCWSVLRVFL